MCAARLNSKHGFMKQNRTLRTAGGSGQGGAYEGRARTAFFGKIRRMLTRFLAAAFAAAVLIVPAAMAGCRKPAAAETSEEMPAEETQGADSPLQEGEDSAAAVGDAASMVEADGRLFFKYGNAIRCIDQESGQVETIRTFGEQEFNQTFWVCGKNLYFDTNVDEAIASANLYGIHMLNLESGEELHLADLVAPPVAIYVSDDVLYVSGAEMNFIYQLDEEGKTTGELSPAETIYAKMPQGCRELYGKPLAYYVERYGYMPVQNDVCLVIADADGSHAREVPEATNTSAVIFGEGCFFVLLQDGNGTGRCWRYDAKTLERELWFESAQPVTLLQYRDGYLYYSSNGGSRIVGEIQFYRLAGKGAAEEQTGRIYTEPGMLGAMDGRGNFFASGDAAYCQAIQTDGVYIARTEFGGETKLLEPALYESPLRALGRVEAELKSVPSEAAQGETVEIYAERLVLSGEGEAVYRMNLQMEERQHEVLAYGEELAKSPTVQASLTWLIGDVTYQSDSVFCIEAAGSEYTGGAHGAPFKEYFVFDRATGNRLGLSDLVDNSQEELQALAGAAFRALAEERNFAFESPEDLEHTVSDDVSFDSDFYLSEEGIVFYYPPYAIAPYSEGFPEAVVPYGALRLKDILQN